MPTSPLRNAAIDTQSHAPAPPLTAAKSPADDAVPSLPAFRGVSGPVAWEVVDLQRDTSRGSGEILWNYTLILRDRSGARIVIERNERVSRQDGPDEISVDTAFQRANAFMYARLAPQTPVRLHDEVRAKARDGGFGSDSRLDDLVVWHTLHARDETGRPMRVVIRFRLEALSR